MSGFATHIDGASGSTTSIVIPYSNTHELNTGSTNINHGLGTTKLLITITQDSSGLELSGVSVRLVNVVDADNLTIRVFDDYGDCTVSISPIYY